MATASTNEFKGGLKVMLDGTPCSIVENIVVKPGKGQAFNRVKLKNLKTGKVLEKTFKSGESIELADVMDAEYQFSYADGDAWYFMHPGTFEMVTAAKSAMGDSDKWLTGQEICVLTLWNDNPIAVAPPNFVELKITESEPGVKGDTASNVTKPAILETGAEIKVPLFVDEGEVVKVDTRTGEYVSRAKS